MSEWPTAIKFVLAREGGLVNCPSDPGGLTNYGISQRAYPDEDIKNMTVERASFLYRRDYWEPCHCDELPGPLSIAVFDCAVNQGVGRAKRLLQLGLNVDVDGVIGPVTVKAAYDEGQRGVRRFLAHRLADYMQIILKNPKLELYRFNWSYRIIKLAALVLYEAPAYT